ncbi:MAG TPA: tripartite tricarboxylate transporter substrate binding protein [Thermodesulfobacteriota bacterium]
MTRRFVLAALAAWVAASAAGIVAIPTAHAQAFPSGPIEIIVPASPGGGWDTTARVVQSVLQSTGLVKVPITIVNRPGAGGQVGWSYLNEHKGNPHYAAMNSNQLFPRQLLGQTTMKFEDFTPLARLTTEYLVLAVRPDSPYKTGKELMAALKADPTKHVVSVGSGQLSSDHVSFLRAAKAAGVDIRRVRVVVHSSGGDQMAAILGGHVDVVSTGLSEAAEQAKAGKLRLIAITAPERVSDAPDVPTWEEMGIKGTFRHWRGIMAPGGIEPSHLEAWDKILGEMARSAAWKKELEQRGWIDAYLGAKEFTQVLHEERKDFETLMRDIGLIK